MNKETKNNKILTILFEGIFYFLLMFILIIVSARLILLTATVYVPSEPISLWYFLFAFALVTFLLLVLLRKIKNRLPFEIFFTFAIFAGIWFLSDIWFSAGIGILVALGIMIVKFIYRRIWWQNLVMVLGVAGIVVSVGLSIPWLTALILMVLLSFYDIIAVYYTKHMVEMFQGLINRGVIFALILPTRVRHLIRPIKEVRPGDDFMLLGTGDLAMPGIMVASLMRVSMTQAVFVGAGAIVGFILMQIIFFSQKRKKPMPALPPIAVMTIVGFLIAYALGL
jgi:presenilin-like A22 family membrane protease